MKRSVVLFVAVFAAMVLALGVYDLYREHRENAAVAARQAEQKARSKRRFDACLEAINKGHMDCVSQQGDEILNGFIAAGERK